MFIRVFENIPPTCLFGPTLLLIIKPLSTQHVYLDYKFIRNTRVSHDTHIKIAALSFKLWLWFFWRLRNFNISKQLVFWNMSYFKLYFTFWFSQKRFVFVLENLCVMSYFRRTEGFVIHHATQYLNPYKEYAYT